MNRGKRGLKRSMAVDAKGIPLGAVSAPGGRRLAASGPDPGGDDPYTRLSARGGERPPRARLRLASYPRAAGGDGARVGDLGQGKTGALLGNDPMGGGADGRVAQHPQEARLVHREGGEGGRLLGAFSSVVIIVRRLIREGWSRYRWEGRPSRRP